MKLLLISTLSAFLVFYSSCRSETSQPVFEIEYDCFAINSAEEIFIVIEEEPVFGTSISDLALYIESTIGLSAIDQIESGEIVLSVIVFDSGATCLSKVIGEGVSEEDLVIYESLINEMPNWVPGKQGGVERNTYMRITIRIIDGGVEEVNSIVGR